MSECSQSRACVFSQSIGSSIVKRIRFASAYPYCRGERSEECALLGYMQRGESVPPNLLPDGSTGDYLEGYTAPGSASQAAGGSSGRFLVVDDSMVFASIATNVIRQRFPDADVVQCHSYVEAEPRLREGRFSLIISGNGIGGGRTVHDVRLLSLAPIVVFTGRPLEDSDLPSNSRLVTKAAGPGALRQAVEVLLGV